MYHHKFFVDAIILIILDQGAVPQKHTQCPQAASWVTGCPESALCFDPQDASYPRVPERVQCRPMPRGALTYRNTGGTRPHGCVREPGWEASCFNSISAQELIFRSLLGPVRVVLCERMLGFLLFSQSPGAQPKQMETQSWASKCPSDWSHVLFISGFFGIKWCRWDLASPRTN